MMVVDVVNKPRLICNIGVMVEHMKILTIDYQSNKCQYEYMYLLCNYCKREATSVEQTLKNWVVD